MSTRRPMSRAKAEALIRLIQHEGKPIDAVHEMSFPEGPDGVPLGVTLTTRPGAHRMAPLRLTSHEWQQVAAYAGSQVSPSRRRELLTSCSPNDWAAVAHAFVKEISKGKDDE